MGNQTDFELIDLILNGNIKSFESLVNKYKSKVYSLCLKLTKNEEEAEELSHDAFLKVLKNLSKFKKDSSFSTWLYRIAYNNCLSRLKKKKLQIDNISDSEFNNIQNETNNPFDELVKDDKIKYLKLALTNLSDQENLMLDFYYRFGKDMNEISEIMGLSHNNVRVKIMRSRQKIYSFLKNELKHEISNLH